MKALVFGSLNIDVVFSVDHIVVPGETISSASLVKGAGGKGANQVALKKQSCDPSKKTYPHGDPQIQQRGSGCLMIFY
jgi:hypothetical protein